jgi:hypothetical protein
MPTTSADLSSGARPSTSRTRSWRSGLGSSSTGSLQAPGLPRTVHPCRRKLAPGRF